MASGCVGHELGRRYSQCTLGIARYRVIDPTPKDDFIRRKGMEV